MGGLFWWSQLFLAERNFTFSVTFEFKLIFSYKSKEGSAAFEYLWDLQLIYLGGR